MSPRRLSEQERKEIIQLYRQGPDTSSTLAERFGVTPATISRILKKSLPAEEYESLIREKRLLRHGQPSQATSNTGEQLFLLGPQDTSDNAPVPQDIQSQHPYERAEETDQPIEQIWDTLYQEEILSPEEEEEEEEETEDKGDEEGINLEHREHYHYGEHDYIFELDWDIDFGLESTPGASEEEQVRILPLKAAVFPKTCYLVIDQSSELIARPLKDFAHLGEIPEAKVSQLTLPVFDNHRAARRFCQDKGKVIKVPDGRILQKTSSYLLAKGISCLLMDGKVYSLADS
ncbi:MAG: helix-turn-helix domain-containing protein [Geminocystis sp.]|nr:helix-turn-helix domain-containing protein [Geminocystis sp.]HIK37311.1 helix-turn-helix domain-containing protein [Geminocystis sp. M7585_C2015_104]MCS7148266.1 helix-turn-helix domain-containing protein [Geminocystis sp.]MCX8077681.1 helix-turn-helix domain-containing protein [Geminocystis sp.]MDW8116573.1 helix-turn-helix domain-containing protein [Geminocystis sp.]